MQASDTENSFNLLGLSQRTGMNSLQGPDDFSAVGGTFVEHCA